MANVYDFSIIYASALIFLFRIFPIPQAQGALAINNRDLVILDVKNRKLKDQWLRVNFENFNSNTIDLTNNIESRLQRKETGLSWRTSNLPK